MKNIKIKNQKSKMPTLRFLFSTFPPFYLSTRRLVFLSTFLPFYLSTRRLVFLSTFLPFYLSTCLYSAFDDFSPGVRAASLGGAFVALSDDASAVFYNPAGLYKIEKNEFLTSYGRLYFGLDDNSSITNSMISYINPFGQYGAAGIGFNSLSLANSYSEKTISVSYGFRIIPKLGFGLTMKSLSHKYESDDFTENAIDNSGNLLNTHDTVFDSGYSKSKLSSDFGVLYRLDPKYNLGFTMQNINSPDVGLNVADKVPKVYRTGIAYMSKTVNMSTEILVRSNDLTITSGFEKYFIEKTIACRGALTFGSNDLKRLTLGFGINQKNYRFDYVFLYPLTGINDIYGSHRVSISILFGPVPKIKKLTQDFSKWTSDDGEKPTAEGTKSDDTGGGDGKGKGQPVSAKATPTEETKPPAKVITDDDRKASTFLMRNVRDAYRKGMYLKASETINKALEFNPEQRGAQALKKKIEPIASIVPEKTDPTRIAKIVRKGVTAYIENNPVLAVNAMRYSMELTPEDFDLQQVFEIVSKEYPEVAYQEKASQGISIISTKLQKALEHIYDGKYAEAIADCNVILELEEDNVLAILRLGSAYWVVGDFEKARSIWQEAMKYDADNQQLKEFLSGKTTNRKVEKLGKKALVRKYVVQKGDTPQKISEKFYKNRTSWGKIYEINKDNLPNRWTLIVGQELVIP